MQTFSWKIMLWINDMKLKTYFYTEALRSHDISQDDEFISVVFLQILTNLFLLPKKTQKASFLEITQ